MNCFSWASYEKGEVTEKIKYWVDLWEEIVSNFGEATYNKELINPHLLLMDLVDEVEYNRLARKRNNEYFLDKLRFYLARDKIIKQLFNTDFHLLINELSQASKRFEYFILLCEQIMKSFRDGTYFKESCKLLKEIILDPQWKNGDEEDILLISQNLMIELILVGYSIEKIKAIPQNLFDKYKVLHVSDKETLLTEYPTTVDAKKYYENGVLNQPAFNEARKAEIDSLSISDRVDRLKHYFDKEPSEGYGIFHIEGLKGNIDDYVGEVNFYSPQLEDYWELKTGHESKTKNFDEIKLKYYDEELPYSFEYGKSIPYNEFKSKVKPASFVNAAVKIKYLDSESAKKQALEVIEKALDILRLYSDPGIEFRVKLNKFYLVNSNGLSEYKSYSANDSTPYKEAMSLDLKKSRFFSRNKEFLSNLKESLFNENLEKYPLTTKLIYSTHWYRKACESTRPEDQLLNYWIVIENLLTFDSKNGNIVIRNQDEKDKFVLVEEIVPYIELSYSIKNVAVGTYYYLKNITRLSNFSDMLDLSGKPLVIPLNILKDCQLDLCIGNREIDLKDFVQKIHLLSSYTAREIIKKRIEFTENFYSDINFTSLYLEEKRKQIIRDLLLIYRYRNLIVHNARFDNKMLPYYVTKAENLAYHLIRKVLEEHIKDRTRSQQEILLFERIKVERIIEKLKNKVPVDLWGI